MPASISTAVTLTGRKTGAEVTINLLLWKPAGFRPLFVFLVKLVRSGNLFSVK